MSLLGGSCSRQHSKSRSRVRTWRTYGQDIIHTGEFPNSTKYQLRTMNTTKRILNFKELIQIKIIVLTDVVVVKTVCDQDSCNDLPCWVSFLMISWQSWGSDSSLTIRSSFLVGRNKLFNRCILSILPYDSYPGFDSGKLFYEHPWTILWPCHCFLL